MKKLGLSIRGAGTQGIAYAGAFQALEENNIKPEIIIGSSSGGAFSMMYAAGIPPLEIKDFLKHVSTFSFVGIESLIGRTLWSKKKYVKHIQEMLPNKRIEDLPIKLLLQFTNTKTKRSQIVDNGHIYDLIPGVMSFPHLIPSYKAPNGDKLIDGDLSSPFAINTLRDFGAEVTIGMRASDPRHINKKSYYDYIQYFQMRKLLKIHDEDLKNNPPDIFIDDLAFDTNPIRFNMIEENFNHGYAKMIEKIEEVKELIK